MILEIPDALAKNIQRRATGKGMTMATYLHTLFDVENSEPDVQTTENLTYDEWRERLNAFQRTRRTDLPILTDDAISRESIYE